MKVYDNGIYPIKLVLTTNFSDLSEKYDCDGEELHDNANARATTYMMTPKRGKGMYVGILFKTPITANTATHEAFHAVCYMLNTGIKMELNDYTDEAWAYLIGWVAQCIDEFRKAMEKKKCYIKN